MDWHEMHDEETTMLLNMLKDFLVKEVRPIRQDYEAEALFPGPTVEGLAQLGFSGLTIPEEYGGLGKGSYVAALVGRELAYEWPSLYLIWTVGSSLTAFPILRDGTEEQKQRYLPRLASGEILGCYCLTEPDSGSDAAAMTTRATKRGEGWILNGAKTFITNAQQASLAIVFAKTGAGKHDIAAFLVEGSMPGFTTRKGMSVSPIRKRLLKSSPFCDVVFEDAPLPKESLLGEEGKGFNIALAALDGGRISIAAQSVGIAARVLDEALAYVKSRKQFERPVWNNQAVQFHFAEWHSQIHAAWALIERAALLYDAGYTPITQMAAYAKLFATEITRDISLKAADYFGGNIATEELPWLSFVMDNMITPIYEGTSNVQKMVIAKGL